MDLLFICGCNPPREAHLRIVANDMDTNLITQALSARKLGSEILSFILSNPVLSWQYELYLK
jgi:hypothetical protein